jgi:hypothetical protein
MAYLDKVDETRKIKTKDGKTKTVGDNKYKLRGFFDPTTEDARAFLREAAQALVTAGYTDKDKNKEALNRCFPLNGSLKAKQAGIPDDWRRITPKTGFGPVEVVDRNDRDVPPAQVYPGCYVIAQVSFFVFEDEKTGEPNVSLRLGPVLKEKDGERLATGSRPSARAIFRGHMGTVTNANPFGDDEEDGDDSPI